MSSTQMRGENATQNPKDAMVDLKLEVVILPVSDVDRAKRFYQRLGWRLDADSTNGDDWRVVQLTPPGSPCSILFGKGITTAVPGSVQGNFLVVDDVEAARAPRHPWPGWYRAYTAARDQGRPPHEAAKDAAIHMEGTRR